MESKCRICSHEAYCVQFSFREMMFGTKSAFEYFQCEKCKTLQIGTIPDNLAEHYPPEYNTLTPSQLQFSRIPGAQVLARKAADYFINPSDLTGRLTSKLISLKTRSIEDSFPMFLREPSLRLRKTSRILDFGSGAGDLLNLLSYYGFTNLVGADRFISEEQRFPNGIEILKRDLADFESDSFDVVMLNHVFEHLPEPWSAFEQIRRILRPEGHAIVRVPVLNHAWTVYGKNWFQLDPPRHLYLFTPEGLLTFASTHGFHTSKVIYDSTDEQFFISEFYRLGVPYIECDRNKAEREFGKEVVRQWQRRATELNSNGEGDQACFYFRIR